uniref:(California timema) hypothetical protein n=1 Tax=Timema californicum TaxID=61474 RepID=A0A7R9JGG9_TIMCA|nr:unnamed protein product [Timema californicum]
MSNTEDHQSVFMLYPVNTCQNSLAKLGRSLGPTKRFIKKPLVAAISGYAVAGGLELALLCDLRVVEETAIMGVFNRHFG